VVTYLKIAIHQLNLETTAFRGKFFQIMRASLPNSAAQCGKFFAYTYVVINLLWPLNPTKYAVFITVGATDRYSVSAKYKLRSISC